MAKKRADGVDRRSFLTGVAVPSAATAAMPAKAAPTPPPAAPSALRPTAAVAKAEMGTPEMPKHAEGRPASDYMVDVIKSLDIDYVPSNPAQSFRGLHESLLTYGGNKKPEFLTCMHEESSVAMAHGYFKIAGKPMLVMCHGTVGLQHASMAIYNAWCDRVPLIVIGGNDLDATKRAPLVPTYHSAQDIGALVREFTKWDDTPMSPAHFGKSFVRAYKIAMTPPHEPVLIFARHRHAGRSIAETRRRCRAIPARRRRKATPTPCARWRSFWSRPSIRSSSPTAPPARRPAFRCWSNWRNC